MNHDSLTGIIIVIPFFLIFLILAIVNSSAKRLRMEEQRARIEELREKVKSLPLDEKTKKERLRMFDEVDSKVSNMEIKMKYFNRLASGEEVKIKKRRKTLFKPYSSEEGFGGRVEEDMLFGMLPSSITHRDSS